MTRGWRGGLPRAALATVTALTVAAVFCACATKQAAAPLAVATVALRDADLALGWVDPIYQESSNFSEQVTIRLAFDGDEDAGAYIRLLVTNIGGADGRAELVTNVTLPGGRHLKSKVRRKRKDWTADRDALGATLGDARIEARVGRMVVHVVGDEGVLDLRLTTALPPLRPAGGRLVLDAERRYVTTVLAPRARVEGTFRPRDGEPVTVTGVGYAEHRVGNIAPYSMAKRWFWIQDIRATGILVLSAFETTASAGSATHGWLLYATEDGLEVFEPEVALTVRETARDAETEYDVPVALVARAADRTSLVVKAGEQTERKDELGSLSTLERLVVERLMKPWSFRYRTDYLLRRTKGGAPPEDVRGEAKYIFQQVK